VLFAQVGAPLQTRVTVDGEALVDDGVAAVLFAVFQVRQRLLPRLVTHLSWENATSIEQLPACNLGRLHIAFVHASEAAHMDSFPPATNVIDAVTNPITACSGSQ
jgi:hypothetical protein